MTSHVRHDPTSPRSRFARILGVLCLASAFASLYFFGCHEFWSRGVGVVLTVLAGGLAWAGERIRSRERAKVVAPTRARYIFIAFALCGAIGFFMPEESRARIAWFAFVFLRRLANLY